MESIKLRDKATGEIRDCKISISSIAPQLIDINVVGGGGRAFDSFEEISKYWEIVPEADFKKEEND